MAAKHPRNTDAPPLRLRLRPACHLRGCRNAQPLDFAFAYAYQPIVDLAARQVFAHEALIRGPAGEPAPTVLSRVTEENRYRFDQACRVEAIRTAAALDMQSRLSINFMPNAIYHPNCASARRCRPRASTTSRSSGIIFETVEGEQVSDGKWLAEVLREYQRIGFLTAIDDFGAGFAGLNLLADFQPDLIKLDMDLIRGIDASRSRQAIVRGVTQMCRELNIRVIAEGVETADEYLCLADQGIELMQGYLFSKPLFGACASADALSWPAAR